MPPELLLIGLLVAFGLVAMLVAPLPELKRELDAQDVRRLQHRPSP